MTASATGEKMNASRLSCDAATTKIVQLVRTKTIAKAGVSAPLGRARVWVRGLAASIDASARRLKAIAADRADTMATIIHTRA